MALVGTRAPTRYGIGVAAQFGADLAAAGVSVVSGLALGIDGAAHEGACGAGAPRSAWWPAVSTSLSPASRAPVGASAAERRHRVGVAGRRPDREMEVSSPEPIAGRPQ